jgi:hypothetical protein
MYRYQEYHQQVTELLEQLPTQLIAHLTFPKPVSAEHRDKIFQWWIAKIQQLHRTQIGYVLGQERWPSRHLHVVLFCHSSLSRVHCESVFQDLVGRQHKTSIRIEEYKSRLQGISYVMKAEDYDGCHVIFSPNLDFFAPWAKERPRGQVMNARQRRQRKRILSSQLPQC